MKYIVSRKNKYNMAELRFSALRDAFNRSPVAVEPPSRRVSEYFGANVFDMNKMERYLSKEAFKIVKMPLKRANPCLSKRPIRWLSAEGMGS